MMVCMGTETNITAAQRKALTATLADCCNQVRASRKVSAAAIEALGRLGMMTVTRDRDGVIGTITKLGAAQLATF